MRVGSCELCWKRKHRIVVHSSSIEYFFFSVIHAILQVLSSIPGGCTLLYIQNCLLPVNCIFVWCWRLSLSFSLLLTLSFGFHNIGISLLAFTIPINVCLSSFLYLSVLFLSHSIAFIKQYKTLDVSHHHRHHHHHHHHHNHQEWKQYEWTQNIVYSDEPKNIYIYSSSIFNWLFITSCITSSLLSIINLFSTIISNLIRIVMTIPSTHTEIRWQIWRQHLNLFIACVFVVCLCEYLTMNECVVFFVLF